MSLKPWREIARPHQDVKKGTFKQAEFAADISQVAAGTATEEYQDAVKFFSRTFITEGMRLLLISVAQRIAGLGGDPVIQLQTAFGGGKTHTMLAVLHLAKRQVSSDQLDGIPPILDQAGIHDLPVARTAVIDGIKLSPSHAQKHGVTDANTLWGELAWQLLGDSGYELVAASDRDGTSPGKEVLTQLLQKAAPCVILIDELQKFFSQLVPGKQFNAGTYESNLAFIQALTEAMKAVPNAILLASLPESESEVGDTFGQRVLIALEKHFGRVESVWKPVATEESFEIVRRRLFEYAGDRAFIEGISRQFCDFYRQHAERFPVETQSNEYFDRMCASYPIHPEIFDRLYQDWSTLDKFQRTRGVLQYMAIVIHRLWNDNNQDALIMPGSLPMADSTVRHKSIHYLPQGWEPVIESEVDGVRSEPHRMDGDDTRFGSVQAAHRTMRTIFLGSAPSAGQMVKGIQTERVLLGSVQPGQTIGIFEDVLKRLRDRLHYLYSDQDRFWLDTKPNLRREMESRKQNIKMIEQIIPELKQRLQRMLNAKNTFSGVHIFAQCIEVPDDYASGPRLVVLPPNQSYSSTEKQTTFEAVDKILCERGEQPRQKRNRLIFLAADTDAVRRLNDAACTYLAWREIVTDIDEGNLNLDLFQDKSARKNLEATEKNVQQLVKEAYKWILTPSQLSASDKKISWEALSIATNASNSMQEIENKLREEEWLISEWSPIHLRNLLMQWYFKDGVTEVSAVKVWQDTCQYLYLPRLVNDQVYRNTIANGLADYFGFASGKDGDVYLGFQFGKTGLAYLDEFSLLIEKGQAEKYQENLQSLKMISNTEVVKKKIGEQTVELNDMGSYQVTNSPNTTTMSSAAVKKRFYASIDMDVLTAKINFSEIIDEVVQQFTIKSGVKVSIAIEISADSAVGFDESLQRTIKENCQTLKFKNFEFEED